jgi:putative ABC transport system permease protein
MGYSLILGLVGGLLPALRAARLPVTTGLREL